MLPHVWRRIGKRRAACFVLLMAALLLVAHHRRGHSPHVDFVEAVSLASREEQEGADTLRQCQPFRPEPGQGTEYTIAIAGAYHLADCHSLKRASLIYKARTMCMQVAYPSQTPTEMSCGG